MKTTIVTMLLLISGPALADTCTRFDMGHGNYTITCDDGSSLLGHRDDRNGASFETITPPLDSRQDPYSCMMMDSGAMVTRSCTN